MAEILKNTGAKLWSMVDDHDELQSNVFDQLFGTGGKSDIRLIDEAIGKINENLNGYYFKIINDKLYICKNSESGITSLPIAIIDNTLSLTSENTIQNKVVTEKFNSVEAKVSTNETTIQSHTTALETLNGEGEGSVKKAVSDGIAKVVADAPEDFDTLKEMSDWISNHESDASAMNSAIQTNKTDIASLKTDKVDKETGKNLLADTDKANYDDAASKAHTHAHQSVLDGITSDKVSAWDAKSDFSGSYNDLSDKPTIPKGDGATITMDADGTLHGSAQVDEMTGATSTTDGKSGIVPAPLKGQENLFLRGDGTWAEASGGGTKITPKATVNPAIKSGNGKCTITWGDPEDIIADEVILSTWKGTKLVMNETGYPQDENDGTVLVDNKVKDAYVSAGYEVTGLTNDNTYYFKLFPYSTDGIYNYQDSNKLLGNPSLVKLDPCTNIAATVAMGSATVSWTDPEATKTVDGITATWAKTVLVYKQGSTAPLSISDGTVAVEETTQNQYSIDGFEVTGLTDGQEYTFALFAVSTEGSSSEAVSTSVQLWATLNITTTEDTLYGKDVTATNDVSTVTGTFSESGSVTLNIPWIGSTTVTATDGTDTGDDTVDIAAYMNTYSLQFTFVPDGETVTPVDDVAILMKCAGVSGTGYTTIAEVIADDDAMSSITMDENAMKYLARSTGFADEVCADETFMTYLGASAWVDDTVLNSDIWKQKIKASQYWSLVYTAVYTIHGAALETITIDGVYGSFTTNSDGNVNHALPLGELTLHGSVSGQSFTRTVTKDTTDVYVMPEGSLYWYGNQIIQIEHAGYKDEFIFHTNKIGVPAFSGDYTNRSDYIQTFNLDFNKYTKFCCLGNIDTIAFRYPGTNSESNTSIYIVGQINGKTEVSINKNITEQGNLCINSAREGISGELYAWWLE